MMEEEEEEEEEEKEGETTTIPVLPRARQWSHWFG